MKSRISIDVDNNNQPVIKIDYAESDDVRDKLVKIFIEGFGHNSNQANVEWRISPEPFSKRLYINPIASITTKE